MAQRKFVPDDEYETPVEAWNMVLSRIPKNLVIWDPFFASGYAQEVLTQSGHRSIHVDRDFFSWQPPAGAYDVIITNPPYSNKRDVILRLLRLNKPFAILIPLSTLTSRVFIDELHDYKVLIPNRRIHFIKRSEQKRNCALDTVWVLVGLDRYFPGRDIQYVEAFQKRKYSLS